ncbi:Zinc finger protein 524 [Oryzias melastigma]|uniref:Zinc finger protein 524 n=1 Tax=Oryzias melastigma TaxID=30732 RepID=A0A834FJ69_ORYME|nr:Zinc finger protein 524 [Oryzias melastigma]
MDSQLASVLTSGSLEVQNGSQCGKDAKEGTDVFLDPKDIILPSTKPGNLKSCSVKAALTIRQDAQSINGKKPEVGGTTEPATQEDGKIGGFRQPIRVKTRVPALRKQPIRIKIVVPQHCKKQITNSAISLTKDFAGSQFKRPVLVSAAARITDKNRNKMHISADVDGKTEAGSSGERGTIVRKDGDVLDVKIVHMDRAEGSFISSINAVEILSHQVIKEGEIEQSIPLILHEIDLKSCTAFNEVSMEEQTEPLDLSLPKKREIQERRGGGFLDEQCCESSLIMEVDEYEGDGDRDMVEEDEEENSELRLSGSPSALSADVLSPLPTEDCDTKNLLLIDDQGIPYTLSQDGIKVPQVDASVQLEVPQTDLPEAEDKTMSPALASPSQDSDTALNAPLSDFYPPTPPVCDLSSQTGDQFEASEVLAGLMTNSDLSESKVKAAQEDSVVLSTSSSGISLPTPPIQILANPSANPPLLFLSSSSSSSATPAGLPVSIPVPPGAASTPVFLLLSSVPSSSGDATSTPVAVLDPSTGQFSQITAAAAPVSLPLSSGQANALGSPLPVLSHPLILSNMNNVTSGSVLTSLAVPSAALALQDEQQTAAPLLQAQMSCSESNPGSEAISAEDVSRETDKPLTFAASPLQSQLATFDSLSQPTLEAQSPASDSKFDSSDFPSEHLPLDDHLYFSNMAPPSPPIGPLLSSGKLDSLDPLDPLSPGEASNSLGSRRVLCCQLCPRIFFYLSDLERHAITHSQKKPHVCQQCGKAFKRSSHLQRHKHIHTGQRNFVCSICTKRFREAGELQRHQRVHTGEKPYQCQLCHTRFAERNTLRRHTKRKHPYHQVALEMLSKRKDKGGSAGEAGGKASVQEEEESAEWYSSTVSTLENSESEIES